MPAKERFAVGADVGDQRLESQHGRDAAEEKHQHQKAGEFPGRDHRRDVPWHEVLPRDDGAKINEHGGIEEEVEDLREVGGFGFVSEPTVPGEACAGAESDEEIVEAEGGADSDG